MKIESVWLKQIHEIDKLIGATPIGNQTRLKELGATKVKLEDALDRSRSNG